MASLIIVTIFTIIAVTIATFHEVHIYSAFFLTALLFIGMLFFIDGKKGLFLLLFIRPVLDVFTGDAVLKIDSIEFNVSALLAIFTIAITAIFLLKKYKIISVDRLLAAWMVFLFITFFSIFFSYSAVISLTEWTRLVSIFSIFILSAIIISSKKDVRQLLIVIAVSAIIPGIFAIYQFLTNTGMTIPLEGITNRIYGTFAHPNLFAYYLLIPIALLSYFLITKKRIDAPKGLLWIFYILLLALTFTRGAWLALILLFAIIGFVRYRKILTGLIIALLLIYITIEPIRMRIDDLQSNNPDSSIYWRKDLWNDGLAIAKEKIVLGHGTGTAQDLILDRRGPDFGSSDPHNDYLKLLLENGLVGLVSYGLLILSLLITLIQKYRFEKNIYDKNLILVLIGLTIAIYAMSSVDNVLRNTAIQWAFWAIMGSFLALKHKNLVKEKVSKYN